MLIKKDRNIAKAFELSSQTHFVQNMLSDMRLCMSSKSFWLNVFFLIAIFSINSTNVFASAAIDRVGNRIYFFLIAVGKWVVIIKGAIDTIQSIINGDFQNAKKTFISYIFAYSILFALPWIFNEIEAVFKEI